jgi:GNAT superfamily N-acetyltransferase
VKPVRFPEGYRLEVLHRRHPRRSFDCGEGQVTDWLRTKALQQQDKHLSSAKVLIDESGDIAGYYTLATNHIDFGELPIDLVRHIPRRALPVAVLAWLGVSQTHQGRGLGDRLVAQALRDCYDAGQIFAFVAVLLDCVDDRAKAFYERWSFAELPGHRSRLHLSARALEAILNATDHS